jgi:6-phosphogluconolactonase (cycloisomerase 2 family)
VVVSNGQPPDAVSASAPLAVQAATARLSAGAATATTATPVATTLSLGEGLQLSWVVPAGSTATLQRGGEAPTPVTTGDALDFPLVDTSYVLAVTSGAGTASYQVDASVKQYAPRFLFVANSGSDDLSSYTVDLLGPTTISGPGPATPAGRAPIHLVASPDERRLYAANAGDGTVSAFDVDPASGALTEVAGSPFALSSPAAAPWASAIDPAGTRLYVACAEGIELFAIDAATGALTAVPGQAVAIPGRRRGDLLVHPTGRALYVADAGHARVKAYAIAAGGALTFSGEAPAGLAVGGLALDRGGRVLFARGASPVAAFNGQLDAIAVEPDGTLGAATTFAGFGPQAAAGVDLPFVRGAGGRHGVATSRRPGVDAVFDGYDGERRASTSYSAYRYDRDAASITSEWIDGVIGWSSPLFVDSFDLVQSGDSVVVDRSGALIVLPIPGDWNRLYAWTQSPAGALWTVNDGYFFQTSKDTGASPAHACFTGTLQ